MRDSMLLTVVSSSILASLACGSRAIGPAQSPAQGRAQHASAANEVEQTELAPAEREPADASAPDLEETESDLPPPAELAPHPHADLSDAELEELLLRDAEALGCASLGRTNAGALFGAVPMPEGPHWNIVNPRETYGTAETIRYLAHAITRVNERFPDTPVIDIGDISRPKGGHFVPHVSHQSGRDVDLGFYYLDDSAWYSRANSKNLDLARTWALVKTAITETDVEVIFVDRSIQALLREYATELGENEAWLDAVFGGPLSSLRPMLQHEKGHKTHFHVRYYNPIAQETGRRVYRALLKHKKIKPPTYYVRYKVRRGDSLIRIAKKHRVSVSALKKANRLRSSRIYAGRTYKIPKRGGVVQPPKLDLPSRRIPGTRVASPTPATAANPDRHSEQQD